MKLKIIFINYSTPIIQIEESKYTIKIKTQYLYEYSFGAKKYNKTAITQTTNPINHGGIITAAVFL